MLEKPQILISEQDLNRLLAMLEHHSTLTQTMQHLEAELARAEVRLEHDIPRHVVRMNTQVKIRVDDQPSTHVNLVYPHEFHGETGQLNVIAPIGAAILGLSEGQSIEWPQPDGEFMTIYIEQVSS